MKIVNLKTFIILHKDKLKYISCIFLLACGIVFASLATDLGINGVLTANRDIVKAGITNLEVKSESVSASNPTIDNTKVEQIVSLLSQGDYYEYSFDITNNGTKDLMIDEVVFPNNDSKVTYTAKYEGITEIEEKDLLEQEQSINIDIKVEYTGEDSGSINNVDAGIEIKYVVADETAEEVFSEPDSFTNDSWETIAYAVKHDNTSNYHVGDTKCVHLDGFSTTNDNGCDGDFKVRIANMSTPTECSNDDFSQSACGFVVEFADAITIHNMNSDEFNDGGWPASEMKTYIDSFIYTSLPSDLQKIIITTKTVSGHNSIDANNYISNDKLYLLDVKELVGSSYSEIDFTAMDSERQLDYYENLGITADNYIGAYKKINNYVNRVWLRSACSTIMFFRLWTNGISGTTIAEELCSVSVAFRIG